jgi:predicted amidohydrolase
MQDLNVTLIQVDQVWENKQANFSKYEDFFSQLNETDLVILPEMFHTGFSMSADLLAEEWENSEGLSFLKKWSARLNSAIYTSLIILENAKCYNRGVFVYPNGNVKHYDKRKSFCLGGEDKFYTAGNTEAIVEWKGWKINLQICYDLRFPELIRNRVENDSAAYDLLVYVANWPERRIAHWEALLCARAIENQCYVVGVNRVGVDENNLVYNGGSIVVSPMGEQLSNLKNHQEDFKNCSLSKSDLQEKRTQLPFLKDR